MVTGAEKDFEAFVVARFAELHAVAAVTTGDCVAAAQMTATALALLADRWPEITTASTPTATARSAVLTVALATTSSASATRHRRQPRASRPTRRRQRRGGSGCRSRCSPGHCQGRPGRRALLG